MVHVPIVDEQSDVSFFVRRQPSASGCGVGPFSRTPEGGFFVKYFFQGPSLEARANYPCCTVDKQSSPLDSRNCWDCASGSSGFVLPFVKEKHRVA